PPRRAMTASVSGSHQASTRSVRRCSSVPARYVTRGWRARMCSPGTTVRPHNSSCAMARTSDSSSLGPGGAMRRTVSPGCSGAVSRYGLVGRGLAGTGVPGTLPFGRLRILVISHQGLTSQSGNRGEQFLRIGVLRVLEHAVDFTVFHDLALLHH